MEYFARGQPEGNMPEVSRPLRSVSKGALQEPWVKRSTVAGVSRKHVEPLLQNFKC